MGVRGLIRPAGDLGLVGGWVKILIQSAMWILPHLLFPDLDLDLIFNIMLNIELQWDKWRRKHVSQTAL